MDLTLRWHEFFFRSTMVQAEDIRKTILRMVNEEGRTKTYSSTDVAQMMDRQNWPFLLDQVKLVADVLAREGRISATSQGEMLLISAASNQP